MNRGMLRRGLVIWMALSLLGGLSVLGAGRDMAREVELEKEFAAKHPDALETFRAARVAFDKEAYGEAERLYRQVLAQAPESDVVLRRLGNCVGRLGKRSEGLELCERAVKLERSADNLSTLAFNLISDPSGAEHREDYPRALQLLKECRSLPHGTDASTLALTAEVAISLKDQQEFQSATALLSQNFPNEMMTHYFAGISAALDHQWVRAEKEIRRAEKLGLSHEAAQKFLDSGVHSRAVRARVVFGALLTIILWVGGLCLLFAVGFLLSKLTLRQVEQTDAQVAASGGERLMRKLYRAVLNVTGVYYYISLPVVIVVVLGIVALILYMFLMIGRIPLKLMALLALGALFTVFAMIKSLFVRVKSTDPGRALRREEAPGLWQLAEEVAGSVGTRAVDELRITPGTDLAVYERGTWRQKLRNQAHRVLLLGTGVLNGFKQNHFRCVLAHEYGHFSNRDTAGGDIALRVRNDMLKFYLAMVQAGQATHINAAFHFLKIYNFIFRRISHGATRLQEILADRVAAKIYGAPAFEGGLTHVIRRSIEFEAAANAEIKQSIEEPRPLQNLYELPAPDGDKVTAEFEKALNRPTTEDDTHPGPRDRFRLVARLQEPICPPREGEVWELFQDPEGIRREMLAQIDKQVAPHREANREPHRKATSEA